MNSIKQVRDFLDGLTEGWLVWNQSYGTKYKKTDIMREVKLGPSTWGFEVMIHPGSEWTNVPIYIEYTSDPSTRITLILPLRNLESELYVYPEDKDLASDFLLCSSNWGYQADRGYEIELVTRDWITEFMDLPEETFPYALKTYISQESPDDLRQEICEEMPNNVQSIASEVG